jgi:hypothetical protein
LLKTSKIDPALIFFKHQIRLLPPKNQSPPSRHSSASQAEAQLFRGSLISLDTIFLLMTRFVNAIGFCGVLSGYKRHNLTTSTSQSPAFSSSFLKYQEPKLSTLEKALE